MVDDGRGRPVAVLLPHAAQKFDGDAYDAKLAAFLSSIALATSATSVSGYATYAL